MVSLLSLRRHRTGVLSRGPYEGPFEIDIHPPDLDAKEVVHLVLVHEGPPVHPRDAGNFRFSGDRDPQVLEDEVLIEGVVDFKYVADFRAVDLDKTVSLISELLDTAEKFSDIDGYD